MTEIKQREDWLSPMNRIIWIKAFRAKDTEVTLRDGRKFIMDYGKKPGVVFVKAKDERVPRGSFELEKVTHNSWLTEQ